MTDESEFSLIPLSTPRLRAFGERLGEKLFEALRGDQNSPQIQKQRKPYAEHMGDAFVMYINIYLFPIYYYACQMLLEFFRHPEMPDSFMYDLVYELPPLHYGLYGAGTILAGSLLLCADLFDNFIENDIEKGELLAIIHSGAILLFVGYSFQMYEYYTFNVSEPAISHPSFEIAYYIGSNFGRIGPFVTVPLLAILATIVHRYMKEEMKEYTQTNITSERWFSKRPTVEQAIEIEYPNVRIKTVVYENSEEITGFAIGLDYEIDSTWHPICAFLHDVTGETAPNVVENGLHLYCYKEEDVISVKSDFPSIPMEYIITYCEFYLLSEGQVLVDRFERFHNIEGDDEAPKLSDHFVEIPAGVAEYPRPSPLADEETLS